jgi:hypothetical protein
MGYRDPIVGQVETVTRGISVSNAAPSTQGLPNVDPVYTWVRLAQRVPVRIRITDVPAGVPLVSGMTVTVTIRGAEARERSDWLRQRFASLVERLHNVQRAAAFSQLRAADRQRERRDRNTSYASAIRTSDPGRN